MLRACPKCGNETDFPATHPSRKGYRCKKCIVKDAVDFRKKNRERTRASNNAYHKKHSNNRAESTAKWRAAHPEKYKAHRAVASEVKAGRLVRQPCEVCGDEKTHAHHDDYSKPLKVDWLCHRHHMELHEKLDLAFR